MLTTLVLVFLTGLSFGGTMAALHLRASAREETAMPVAIQLVLPSVPPPEAPPVLLAISEIPAPHASWANSEVEVTPTPVRAARMRLSLPVASQEPASTLRRRA